eukprot:1280777-Amorphochlora_amoeboformis.AAC.1
MMFACRPFFGCHSVLSRLWVGIERDRSQMSETRVGKREEKEILERERESRQRRDKRKRREKENRER